MFEDFAASIKHTAAQQSAGDRTEWRGRVSSYDATLHKVRVIIPSLRNEDNIPSISPWMPLDSGWVGNGFGFQVAPLGGATPQDISVGEPCIVTIIQTTYGVSARAALVFDETALPPGQTLAAGAALMQHKSGANIAFDNSGDITITTTGKTVVNATGDCDITSQGNVSVTSQGNANIMATGSVDVTAPEANIIATGSVSITTPLTNISGEVIIGTGPLIVNGQTVIVP